MSKQSGVLTIQSSIRMVLSQPQHYFKEELGEKTYTGIPHPKSKHSGALPPEVIEPWAQRITNWIERN